MADGDVIADEQDTTQESPAPEALEEAVTADLAPDVEADEGADDTTLPADETPESLEMFLARNEAARAEHDAKIAERENAGANRERSRLQREAGKKDVTVKNVQRWATEVFGAPLEDTAHASYLYDLAAANAAHELASTLPDVLMSDFKVPVEAREQAVEARERGDWNGYIGTLITGAVTAEVTKQREGDEARINAEVQKRLASEIKARRIEAAPVREGAPAAPRSAAPEGLPNPNLMSPAAYEQWKQSTPPATQAQAWAQHSRVAV